MSANAGTVRAFVALGANLGSRRSQLARGLVEVERTPGVAVVACSPWFENPAVGGPEGQPDYLNGVAEVATSVAPRALLARLLEIERLVGRDRRRERPNGSRVLDLDLLLYGDVRERAADLTVPHPRLEERTFVLAPLARIAPGLVLPSGVTVERRLDALIAAGADRLEPSTPGFVGSRVGSR